MLVAKDKHPITSASVEVDSFCINIYVCILHVSP